MKKTDFYCKGALIATIYDQPVEIPDNESTEEGNTIKATDYVEAQLTSNMMFDSVDDFFVIKKEDEWPQQEDFLEIGNKVPIRTLLYPQFNSIRREEDELNLGWVMAHFTAEELHTVVTIEGFYTDLDGYLCVLISGLDSSDYSRGGE